LLHDTELPDTIFWAVDSVSTGGQFPPGDPVAVAVAVGVGDTPPPAQTFSVSALATVLEPLYPPAPIIRLLPIAEPVTNDRNSFMFGELVQVSVLGS